MNRTRKQEKQEPQATYICINPDCLKPFKASERKWKTAQYCSSACRQKAYRIRKTDSAGKRLQPALG